MKKSIFAICDMEAEYAANFTDFLNQKRNIPFDIQAFTCAESLLAFGREHYIELLLISGRTMCPEIRELGIGKIIILSEGNYAPELEVYPSVYKYQATSAVVREVMACYGEEKTIMPSVYPILKKKTKIIGVYSPVRRCLKTSFALTLGQLLARDQAVLYLNLEGLSGFESMMGKSFSHTLSDLLYYVKQKDSNLILRMNSMIETENELDYIPPVQAPSDIPGTVWEDWERLLSEIDLHSSYEVLLLDIGDGVSDLFPMLERCDSIYMPVLEDLVSEGKIRQFEGLLKAWDYTQILPRIKKLKLPIHMLDTTSTNYVRQLPFSDLGVYVKAMLLEEKELL